MHRLLPLALLLAGLAFGYLLGVSRTDEARPAPIRVDARPRAMRVIKAPPAVAMPRPDPPQHPVVVAPKLASRIAALERSNLLLRRENRALEIDRDRAAADALAADAELQSRPPTTVAGEEIVWQKAASIQQAVDLFGKPCANPDRPDDGLPDLSVEDLLLARRIEDEVERERDERLRALLGERAFKRYQAQHVTRTTTIFVSGAGKNFTFRLLTGKKNQASPR